MAKQEKSLTDHPEYKTFRNRFAFDLDAFSIAVCKRIPTNQQSAMFTCVEELESRTSVSSGHGTGKTGGIGVITLWHLLCYPLSNTIISAPRIAQVKNLAWKEIVDLKTAMQGTQFAWIADFIVVDAERIYIKGFKEGWYVIAKTAPRGNPENLAGEHRDYLLWIVDEASGVEDGHYSVMTGALTGGDYNRMLLTSQPTRPSGFFYDTHHKFAKKNGGKWHALTFSSEDSLKPEGLVSVSFIEEKRLQYTEEEYDIKVLGRFPDKTDGFLLGRKEVEACFRESCIGEDEPYGYMTTADVGGGSYRDESVLLTAKVIGEGDYGGDARRVHIEDIPICSSGADEIAFAGSIYDHLISQQLSNETHQIDAGSSGRVVAKILEEKGLTALIRVLWGELCFKNENKERFINKRAQCSVYTARAVREGRLTINPNLPKSIQNKILDQASRIPFKYDEKARFIIEKKEEMRKKGIPSPDIWDCVCFLFLEGSYYSVFTGDKSIEKSKEDEVFEAEADEFFNSI